MQEPSVSKLDFGKPHTNKEFTEYKWNAHYNRDSIFWYT
jgi:hypothetical protein